MPEPHACRHCGKPTEFLRQRYSRRERRSVEIRECLSCKRLFKVFLPPKEVANDGDHPKDGA